MLTNIADDSTCHRVKKTCRDGRDVVIVAVLAEEREGRERAISKDNKKHGLLHYNISVLHEKNSNMFI
jgi:hypothetical protein